MALKGIDVSHWQIITDFDKVAKSVDFVILKLGGNEKGSWYTDSKFHSYFWELVKRKVPVGLYVYAGAQVASAAIGRKLAQEVVKRLTQAQIMPNMLEMGVWLDMEENSPSQRHGATDAVINFCNELKRKGYRTGVYASDISGFKNRLDHVRLAAYNKWVAKYSSNEPNIVKNWAIWQYSSKGHIDGISNFVDLNVVDINNLH